MKFKKIGTKMLAFIIPVIILAFFMLTIVSVNSSKRIIQSQIQSNMTSELNSQTRSIESSLNVVSATASDTAQVISTTYKSEDLSAYEKLLGNLIQQNDMISGMGIWFEPYVYDSAKQYVGPYVYKNGTSVETTYDYSNADYNYFNQDYYKTAKDTKKISISDPYYDKTSKTSMSTCSIPIFDKGTFIGCVTVDIKLDTIQKMISSIKVGKNGTGLLLTSQGVYIGGASNAKIQKGTNIKDESNSSLKKAGEQILTLKNGLTQYSSSHGSYNLYFDTIPNVNWKLAISMPQSELQGPVNQLILLLVIICFVAIAASVLVVILQASSISKRLSKVQAFALSLSDGDFSIEPLIMKSQDEVGTMGSSLNHMYISNKEIISNISEHAAQIDTSSRKLSSAAVHLNKEFEQIEQFMSNVNESMMNASAATEQVNASTEEVESNVNILAEETIKGTEMAVAIRDKAIQVSRSSNDSFDKATSLSTQFEEKLKVSIENAKVVENIGHLATVISNIAEQINLLSLNASIEAARAGEQGKGFAVVASEIGKLAAETSKTVDEIQNTIFEVHQAFDGLTTNSKDVLYFVQNTVTNDYDNFVKIAAQYGEDAKSLEVISSNISEMAGSIKHIMGEVTEAIQNIAESAQSTADSGSHVTSAVEDVSSVVHDVSDMSAHQEEIADNLNSIVKNYKL